MSSNFWKKLGEGFKKIGTTIKNATSSVIKGVTQVCTGNIFGGIQTVVEGVSDAVQTTKETFANAAVNTGNSKNEVVNISLYKQFTNKLFNSI